MKRKQSRSGKAVKPASRNIRRVTKKQAGGSRRKTGPAKAKRAKTKRPKKAAAPTTGKTALAAKAKRVRKRIIRKPKTTALPVSVEVGQPEAPPAALPARQRAVAPLEPVEVPRSPAQELPKAKAPQPEPTPLRPSILLEGDQPHGRQAAPRPAQAGHEDLALPEAYGTGKLLLVAREPHWLYAWWDLMPQQQRSYNARSAQGHLVVRVHSGATRGQPLTEAHVHPESRHWFIHVDRAGSDYVAELGYYGPQSKWATVATSTPAKTPQDTVSTDQTLVFATIPTEVPLTQLAALAKQTIPADLPPVDAARERVLAELVALHADQPGGASSAELAGLARGPVGQEVAGAQVPLPAPLLGEAAGASSPMGAWEQPAPGFWFSVNAELVIYGATEPEATLTIGGQPVPLRPDGTFSCRYALPDGDHAVTVSAVSPQGDLRQAELRFTRRTEHQGEVGTAPQDPSLTPPDAPF